jgi:tRNA G18 (ribose-2'-O)-methylase SpoU
LILDHIRSAYNVGNIIRTSECLGAKEIQFVGYTPLPDNEMVMKTSMGTYDRVPWNHFHHLEDCIQHSKKQGRKIYALETSSRARPLDQLQFHDPFSIILGNERFGVESKILEEVDEIIKIPMMGVKNSLNVANCFSIFAFELYRQWSDNNG